jgi:hypothetical protein
MKTTATAEVEITAEMMADWFWNQSTVEQADFLEALAKRIQAEKDPKAAKYSFGELQWCYLKDELRRPGRELANEMHMALSAFAFEFWPHKQNGARTGL